MKTRKLKYILVTPLGTFEKAVEETDATEDQLHELVRNHVQVDAFSMSTESGEIIGINKQMMGQSIIKIVEV